MGLGRGRHRQHSPILLRGLLRPFLHLLLLGRGLAALGLAVRVLLRGGPFLGRSLSDGAGGRLLRAPRSLRLGRLRLARGCQHLGGLRRAALRRRRGRPCLGARRARASSSSLLGLRRFGVQHRRRLVQWHVVARRRLVLLAFRREGQGFQPLSRAGPALPSSLVIVAVEFHRRLEESVEGRGLHGAWARGRQGAQLAVWAHCMQRGIFGATRSTPACGTLALGRGAS